MAMTREDLDRALYAPTPPDQGDVLAQLGFIDPQTGQAFQTGDWDTPPTQDRSGFEWDDAPAAPLATRWDTPENPYKKDAEQFRQASQQDPVETSKAWLQNQYGEIERTAANFRAKLLEQRTAQGYQAVPVELANLITALGVRAAAAEARETAFQYATYDVATEKAARKIAKEHSVGGVRIDPRELAQEQSAEAMGARARALASMQSQGRDNRFAARQAAGVDRREGGAGLGNSLTKAYDSLSPSAMIRLGLLRGE